MSVTECIIYNGQAVPVCVARSTASSMLKIGDNDERMTKIGLAPAFAVKHESGNGYRMYYQFADVEAVAARLAAAAAAEEAKARAEEIAAIDAQMAELQRRKTELVYGVKVVTDSKPEAALGGEVVK